jgi:hypothetical protein
VPTDVVATDEFVEWYDDLDDRIRTSVMRPIRVFYIFDVIRQAVLLVGGDKTGNARFYLAMVPFAEAIWERYQAEQEKKR